MVTDEELLDFLDNVASYMSYKISDIQPDPSWRDENFTAATFECKGNTYRFSFNNGGESFNIFADIHSDLTFDDLEKLGLQYYDLEDYWYKKVMQNYERIADLEADMLPDMVTGTFELRGVSYERLKETSSYDVIASIVDELIDKVEELMRYCKSLKTFKGPITKAIEGKRFCITGKLLHNTRQEAERLISLNGGIVGGISKDTDYLITNNPNSSSSKNQKATEYGIEKITEDQFMQMLEG